MIWSGAMMLDFLTEAARAAARRMTRSSQAIEAVIAHGPRTPDLGGDGKTEDVGRGDRRTRAGARLDDTHD